MQAVNVKLLFYEEFLYNWYCFTIFFLKNSPPSKSMHNPQRITQNYTGPSTIKNSLLRPQFKLGEFTLGNQFPVGDEKYLSDGMSKSLVGGIYL